MPPDPQQGAATGLGSWGGDSLHALLERALEPWDPPGARWLIAFSGGPDSLALAVALAPLAHEHGITLHLAHVDHQMDPGSSARALRAAAIARELGLACDTLLRPVAPVRHRGESPESAARRVRYAALEELRIALRAARLLTAHHREDQAETLLLRIAAGTGLAGLAGIAARRRALWRPSLAAPRELLRSALPAAGPAPIEDPTNRDLGIPRNRMRHLMAWWTRDVEPELAAALGDLAAITARALPRLGERLTAILPALENATEGLPCNALRALPEPLQRLALAELWRRSSAELPAPGKRRLDPLIGALARGHRVELRLGRFRLHGRAGRVCVSAIESPARPFSYTVSVPGEAELPELGLRFRIRRSAVEDWMREGSPVRAALVFPEASTAGGAVLRSRRPGDRLRPLGGPGARKLAHLLIDRKVPRDARDRLPLLVIDGRIAWVPGVTIEDDFRLRDESSCWLAELLPRAGGPAGNSLPRSAVLGTEKETN